MRTPTSQWASDPLHGNLQACGCAQGQPPTPFLGFRASREQGWAPAHLGVNTPQPSPHSGPTVAQGHTTLQLMQEVQLSTAISPPQCLPCTSHPRCQGSPSSEITSPISVPSGSWQFPVGCEPQEGGDSALSKHQHPSHQMPTEVRQLQ